MSDEQITPSQDLSTETTESVTAPDAQEAPAVVTRTRGSRARKTAPAPATETPVTETPVTETPAEAPAEEPAATKAPAKKAAAKRAPAKKAVAKKAPAKRTTTKRAAAAEAAAVDAPLDFAAEAVTADGTPDEVQATGAAESALPEETAAVPATEAAPTVTRTTRGRGTRRTAKAAQPESQPEAPSETAPEAALEPSDDDAAAGSVTMPVFQAPVAKAPARRTRKRAATAEPVPETSPVAETAETAEPAPDTATTVVKRTRRSTRKVAAPVPDETVAATAEADPEVEPDSVAALDTPDTEPATVADVEPEAPVDEADSDEQDSDEQEGGGRRRRRRGGRRRRRSGDDTDSPDNTDGTDSTDEADSDDTSSAGRGGRGRRTPAAREVGTADEGADTTATGPGESDDDAGDGSSRRRRRRRRGGDASGDGEGDAEQTTTRVRRPRNAEDEITSLAGSTRLEAKKQRRREGREAGRRRAPIVSEAEFLARRESVDRTMVIRQRDELTQIGVLEDKVLVEHYVARESQTSLIGNVYLGRVQNVLPSMEAAFIDIGKGRNAVLYAGEVNWSSLGHREGQPRKIESVLTSGQPILVQVTKDPVGQKGARLSSQVSLAGRFLVYVPDGTTSGISRKLPDTERNRLKTLLKEIVPETAGVIVRTAAEGASEAELTQDVERLKARWEDIEAKARGNAPALLYGEPDLTLKVVRDLFTEDFGTLVIQGDDAWDTVQGYVEHVAPDLAPRLQRYDPAEHSSTDLFATYRVEEQIAKGLDRKVWLPSGGSLVIDRTEAMTVVDVNTGKFTGSGGNLEETVTKNNLEAAEEIVRQLRLRDIGGIIVVDFIDMVLESNRDLVLRRLVECLGRDRTRHQVAEVTSLGLVQMTRKRIGTGLLETFGENCAACHGRGVVVHDHPVEPQEEEYRRGGSSGSGSGGGQPAGRGRGRGGRGRGQDDSSTDQHGSGGSGGNGGNGPQAAPPRPPAVPSPTFVAAIARPENADVVPLDERTGEAADQVARVAAEVTAQVTPEVFPVSVPVQVVEPVEPEVVAEVAPVAAARETAPEPEARFPLEQPDEQPRVVARSRRRSATRPAGPPEGAVGTVVSLDPDARSSADDDAADAGDLPVVEHVAVTRRAARRR